VIGRLDLKTWGVPNVAKTLVQATTDFPIAKITNTLQRYNMNKELSTTIYSGEDEPIYVSGLLIPGLPCQRFEYGAPMDPDDDPEVEVTGAVDDDGKDVELTEEQEEEAIEKFKL
tara:strand:- start:1470 stop:1814 length:345 start_codon:yes stop_codon:yes gene_type:complete